MAKEFTELTRIKQPKLIQLSTTYLFLSSQTNTPTAQSKNPFFPLSSSELTESWSRCWECVSFCLMNTNWSHQRRRNLNWESVVIRLTYKQALRHFLDGWSTGKDLAHWGTISPPPPPLQVFLGCIRMQIEQAKRRKLIRSSLGQLLL